MEVNMRVHIQPSAFEMCVELHTVVQVLSAFRIHMISLKIEAAECLGETDLTVTYIYKELENVDRWINSNVGKFH